MAPGSAAASMQRRQRSLPTGRMSNTEFKRVLGFHQPYSQRVYHILRGEIKIYMGVHGISNRTQAGSADWGAMIDWVLSHHYMRSARCLHRGDGPEGVRKLRRAVHFLCLSCARSLYVSPGLLDQVLGNSSDDEPYLSLAVASTTSQAAPITSPAAPITSPAAPTTSAPTASATALVPASATALVPASATALVPASATALVPASATALVPPSDPDLVSDVVPVDTAPPGRTILIELVEPDYRQNHHELDTLLIRYYAALMGQPIFLMSRLWMACKKHMPAGRSLTEIRGCTVTPGEEVSLTDHKEVSAWLAANRGLQPLRVTAVLRRKSLPRPVVVSTQLIPSPPSTSQILVAIHNHG